MPTSRNARGVDIVIYSQDGVGKHTIQAKSLTKRNLVPIGTSLDSLFADYLIICRNVLKETVFYQCICSYDNLTPHPYSHLPA
jgi:hypothetical protein